VKGEGNIVDTVQDAVVVTQIEITDVCEDSKELQEEGSLLLKDIEVRYELSSQMVSNALQKHSDFRGDADEWFAPEVVFRVSKELDEGDEGSPRVRAMDDEAFQENLGHDFSETIVLDFEEEVE
jgi:hypothetical protein